MSYASDITSFDEFVVPWEQLRLFAFAALLVGFTIAAAAFAISAVSATCAVFASLTSSSDIGGGTSRVLKLTPPARLPSFPLASSKSLPVDAAQDTQTVLRAVSTPPGATTPRAASTERVTTTPSAKAPAPVALGKTATGTTAALDGLVHPNAAAPQLVPLPPRRPFDAGATTASTELAPVTPLRPNREPSRPAPGDPTGRAGAASEPAAPTTAAPQDDRNPLQKLFAAFSQATNSAFASRTEGQGALAGLGGRTALYDIEAHTVYLPSGDKLEAHSGLGNRFDDPRHVNEKNRGATPPGVYELELRRDLFHGVAALRLNPVGGGNMFGRNGILAHSYMLGARGESNGCVSFRDYPKFLRAFQNGEISRIAVVSHAGASYSVASSHN